MAGGDFHRGFVRLYGNQALLLRHRVARLYQQFNHCNFVKITDIGNLDLDLAHSYSLQCHAAEIGQQLCQVHVKTSGQCAVDHAVVSSQ